MLSVATTLSVESCTSTIGWVVNGTPDPVPPALRFKTILLASPGVTVMLWIAAVREGELNETE